MLGPALVSSRVTTQPRPADFSNDPSVHAWQVSEVVRVAQGAARLRTGTVLSTCFESTIDLRINVITSEHTVAASALTYGPPNPLKTSFSIPAKPCSLWTSR
jgi:hypothetical protein